MGGGNETQVAAAAAAAAWEEGWEIIFGFAALGMLCQVASTVLARRGGVHPAANVASKALALASASLAWWFAAMALTVTNRTLLTHALGGTWRFPFTTALVHVTIKCALSAAIVHGRARARHSPVAAAPVRTLLAQGGGIGAAMAMDIALSAASLRLLHIALYTMAKNTSVLWTLALSLAAGLARPSALQGALVLAILGGMLLATTGVHGVGSGEVNGLGLALAVGSTMAGAARWVLSERLMKTVGSLLGPPPPGGTKPDAWEYTYLVSPGAVLALAPLAAVLEGAPLAAALAAYTPLQGAQLAGILVGTALLATLLVLTQAIVLRATSALSVTVLAFVKDSAQIAVGSLALGEALHPRATAGIAVVLCASAAYGAVRVQAAGKSTPAAPASEEEEAPLVGEEGVPSAG